MENSYYSFFIISPLGLESLVLDELINKTESKLKFKIETPHLVKGGIEIKVPLEIGFALNLILRTPTRILLRIDDFKCRDLPKLFQKSSKIKWSNYLLSDQVEFECSSKESRLFDDRKIEKAIQDAITLFFDSNPRKKKYIELQEKSQFKAKIYARFENDQCTLSIDTSGELLFKRNQKFLTGLAPIRENLAALLLRATTQDLEIKNYNLIDPMCGSGTFLLEAKNFNNENNYRHFHFEYIPLFIESKNKNLQIEKNIPSLQFNCYGMDINPEIVKLASENLIDQKIIISKSDVFTQKSFKPTEDLPNIIILNPPYGIRVKTDKDINQKYFEDLLNSLKMNFHPLRIGIIIPSQYNTIHLKDYELKSRIKFKNGGIPVTFYVYSAK